MASPTAAKDRSSPAPSNNIELNLSWFTKRDKPLISIVAKKDDTSSESSSSDSEEEIVVNNPLEEWYAATRRREMTLVTAGRSGAGKSTLISNMLQLKDDAKELPCHKYWPSSITREVKVYSSQREGGITVRMVDTPCLGASHVNGARVMALLQEKTRGKCDMLLYCVSLLPDSKLDKEDKELIRKLTLVFGQDVWKRTVLVLTFANAVNTLYPEQSIKDIVYEYARCFQSLLNVHTCDVSVVSFFSRDWSQTHRDSNTIIAVPAGYSSDEQFVRKLRQGWDEMIFGEVLKKCKPDAVPILFETKRPSYPRLVRMPLYVCKFVAATTLIAALGGQPLGITLALFVAWPLGAVIGLFTPRFGAGLGAALGYATGLGVAGVVFAPWLIGALRDTEREQCELDAVQNELKKFR